MEEKQKANSNKTHNPLVPYIISVILSLAIYLFFISLTMAFDDTHAMNTSKYSIWYIVTIIFCFANPIYLVPYLYMRKNEKHAEHSKYYGINIALLSVTVALLINIFLFIIVYALIFVNINLLAFSEFIQLLPIELNARLSIGTTVSETYILTEIFEVLTFITLITFVPSAIYLLYGFIRSIFDARFKKTNEYEKRLYKKLFVISGLCLFILFLSPLMQQLYAQKVITTAISTNDPTLCKKLKVRHIVTRCSMDYGAAKKDLLACNNSPDVWMCISETAKYDTDWKKCLEYTDKVEASHCISTVGSTNKFFKDKEMCASLENIYDQIGDTSAYKNHVGCYARVGFEIKDVSICQELKLPQDRNNCVTTYNNILANPINW